MVKFDKKSLIFILTPLIVILLDQFTKNLMIRFQRINIIGEVVKLEFSKNYGAGFSLFQGQKALIIWFTIFVIGMIIYLYDRIPEKITVYPALILGGAIGNLIDRLMYGFVIDFVDFDFWRGYFLNIYWKIWPAFNISDIAIFIGVIGIIAYYWNKEKDKKLISEKLEHKK